MQTDRLLTVREIADALHISERQVWRLCMLPGFPKPLKLSARVVRFHADDLAAYVNRLRGAG